MGRCQVCRITCRKCSWLNPWDFPPFWLRDVPFNVPSFGDAGQVFDPFVYLGYLAAGTKDIALGVSSIILPLRHPAHVAKAAASADQLSDGRLILGVASGDRPGRISSNEYVLSRSRRAFSRKL